jgi:hypothetical protein
MLVLPVGALLVSRARTTVAPASGPQSRVDFIEWMSVNAMRFRAVDLPEQFGSDAATCVNCTRHRFEVVRIEATTVTAKVIEVKTIRDVALPDKVCEAMYILPLAALPCSCARVTILVS